MLTKSTKYYTSGLLATLKKYLVWMGIREQGPHSYPACMCFLLSPPTHTPLPPFRVYLSRCRGTYRSLPPLVSFSWHVGFRDPYWWTCLCCCEPRGDVNCVRLFLWGWLLYKKNNNNDKKKGKEKRGETDSLLCLSSSLKKINGGARGWNFIIFLNMIIIIISFFVLFCFVLLTHSR